MVLAILAGSTILGGIIGVIYCWNNRVPGDSADKVQTSSHDNLTAISRREISFLFLHCSSLTPPFRQSFHMFQPPRGNCPLRRSDSTGRTMAERHLSTALTVQQRLLVHTTDRLKVSKDADDRGKAMHSAERGRGGVIQLLGS